MVVVDGLKIQTKAVQPISMMRTEIWSVIGTNQNGVHPTRGVSVNTTGARKKFRDEERTEWLQGTGDGFLVWDINGNGKIDSNTEMMSEFDAEGNKVFENG